MSEAAKRYLTGLTLLLLIALAIGFYYDAPLIGLVCGALVALIYNVRYLLAFDRALRTDDFSMFRYGDGIWQSIYSNFRFQRNRSDRYKKNYLNLIREIRRSTNAMYDGAVVLDANDEILMCNRAAKQLAGFKRKKDRGQRVDNILRAPELKELLRDGDFSRAIEIRSPVHPDIWLNCRIAPYGGGQKLLFLRDVTERVQLNKMRRDFVANASHELRSPLTVISGYIDAMGEDAEIPRQWNRPVEEMQSQARRMEDIISELMELSRLENESAPEDGQFIDMAALIRRVSAGYEGRPGSPEIIVNSDGDTGLIGNPTEIESVVRNLLANAVRHTPPDGRITIDWSATDGSATLAVSDNGEGIAEEHIPRLTERFFRVDRGRSRGDGGVGLGLAIVKHILNRHDSELAIESRLKEGSRFACTFPRERTDVPLQKLGTA